MDNTGNNDMALVLLNRWIIEDSCDGFDPEMCQIHYFAHIINLVVKELIFGK